MKKAYKKPELAFESFKLSQSIAAGCMYISHHQMYSCSVKTDFFTVFLSDVCIEDGGYTAPDYQDMICYDNPNDDKRVFTS